MRPLRATALATAAVLAGLGPATVAADQQPGGETREAIVFLIDRVTLPELLAVPEVAGLAGSGGIGLAPIRPGRGDRGLGGYLTIGAGARAAVPFSRIAPDPARGAALPRETLRAIEDANTGAVPGLLSDAAARAGVQVELFGNADDRFGPNAPGLLVGMDRDGVVARGFVTGLTVPARGQLGASRTDFQALGAAMIGSRLPLLEPPLPRLGVFDLGDTHRIDEEAPYAAEGLAPPQRQGALLEAGRFIRSVVEGSDRDRVLVVIAVPAPPLEARRRGELVTPLVVADGRPEDLFLPTGRLPGLTSDSTRREGVVLGEDVAPTLLEFLDVPVPAEMTGAPIRIEGEAPIEAYLRHVEHRRIRIPVQAGFGLGAVVLAALAALAAYARRPLRPAVVRAAGAGLAIATAVPLALLIAGRSPGLTYGWVVPVALAVAAVVGAVAWARRARDPAYPLVVVAGVTASVLVVDGLLGWRAMDTPLFGGTVFEGRAYGLRNLWAGALLAGVVLLGARLSPRRGLVLGVAAALFAGIAGLGSNLGAFATLLGAALLLFFRRSRGRVGAAGWLVTLGSVVAGVALLVALDGLLNPTPTHAGRFAERVAGSGLSAVWSAGLERLRLSVELINHVPPAWLLVGWLLFAAWLAPRVGGRLGAGFDASPGFRAAMSTLPVAALLGIVLNDSGISLAQAAGAFSIAGFVLPALIRRERETPEAPAGDADGAGDAVAAELSGAPA